MKFTDVKIIEKIINSKYDITKEIVKVETDKIVNMLCKKNNISKINYYIVTVPEYNKEVIKNNKFVLENGKIISEDCNPDYANGYFHGNYFVIYIKNDNVNRLVKIIKTIFHELLHYIYDEKNNVTYNTQYYEFSANWNNFGFFLDHEIHKYDGSFYKTNHDQNLFEIYSNYLGVKEAMEYIKNNEIKGIDLNRDLEYLKVLEVIYNFDWKSYKYSDSFDRYIKVYRNNKNKMTLPLIFKYFLDDDGSFKSIEDIASCDIFFNSSQIQSVIDMIFASKTFEEEVMSYIERVGLDKSMSNVGYAARKIINIYNYSKTNVKKREISMLEYYIVQLNQKIKFKYSENKKMYLEFIKEMRNEFQRRYPQINIKDAYNDFINGKEIKI